VVIHQEKNTQTEQVAQAYARQLFEEQGYRMTRGKKGCDFIARKKNEVIPVEVKGRSKLMNFTNMSKHQLDTLQQAPNARVIVVYVTLKDKPQALVHVALTKDDIASTSVSSYRVKWKVPLEKSIMEALNATIERSSDLVRQYESETGRVETGSYGLAC
jgi:hypothetical protein